VVSPLKFLIRDQITELRKHVIMAYVILERMEKEEIDGMLFSILIYHILGHPYQTIIWEKNDESWNIICLLK
jgi:hypothetical protein